MLDLFGLQKDAPPKTPPPAREAREAPRAREPSWGLWLFLDTLLLVGFAALFGSAVYRHLAQPPQLVGGFSEGRPPAPPKPAPSPQPSPAAAESRPAPKPAPEPPSPSGSAAAPASRGPIGSPAVNAPELPQRRSPEPVGQDEPAKRTGTRAIDFTYIDPNAREVTLLGFFLVRSGGRQAMSKSGDGAWQTTVYLNVGASYQYRFEVTDDEGRRALTPKKSIEVY